MKLIDGKKIAGRIEEEIKRIPHLTSPIKRGRNKSIGGLGVILVGDNPESRLYVRLKEEAAKRVGIKFEKFLFQQDTRNKIQETNIIKTIKKLNADPEITGIIVQLPLPEGLDTNKIIRAIDPKKDADGYHPENLKKFQEGDFSFFPPVLGAVVECIKYTGANLKEKTVAMFSNSEIFPIPYFTYFKKNAKDFNVCGVKKFGECLLSGDIVITAIGKKQYLKSHLIKPGAIVVDVGIIKESGKIYGDADAESLAKKASWLTPVPGGVGPITVACLLKNVAK
ncbi:bifunctional 5,10-methylenetetrahydrofolate dehydrogenase/5,10-methenyltetrahydrofolate cyclohydrolase [Patescibacteria group bacterium]|nr:bifunctional 5,10-methylenetetrahydrofolate dehydrogenase/5,10-methenyltetrahydrofolate cyclohydrolase [Patescibacteria group bacterium]